jgi:hypothetical protein
MSSISLVLRKLRNRSWAERWLLIRAIVALTLTRAAVRLLPFRVIARVLGLRHGPSVQRTDAASAERALQIGLAVRAVAAHLPWQSSCLTQALAAAALLRLSGIGATLSFGVARVPTDREQVIAHAWLCSGELMLTGELGRHRFTEFTSFTAHGR